MLRLRAYMLLLGFGGSLLTPVASDARTLDYESLEEVPYSYIMSDGPSTRMRNGATVYKGKPRGFVDDEPMTVVIPMYRKRIPPRVDVIAYTEKEAAAMIWDTRRRELVGEDKIFTQINEDVIKSRCFLLGEDCEKTQEYIERQEKLYPPVEAPAKDLEIVRERNKVRVRLDN